MYVLKNVQNVGRFMAVRFLIGYYWKTESLIEISFCLFFQWLLDCFFPECSFTDCTALLDE